jgi:hypothetical protein
LGRLQKLQHHFLRRYSDVYGCLYIHILTNREEEWRKKKNGEEDHLQMEEYIYSTKLPAITVFPKENGQRTKKTSTCIDAGLSYKRFEAEEFLYFVPEQKRLLFCVIHQVDRKKEISLACLLALFLF